MDKNLKILVVDGVTATRRVLQDLLGELGFSDDNVAEAESGDHALSRLRQQDMSLVVTDANLPDMPGVDLLRKIRADTALASLPVLMVGAESSRGQVIAAAQAGVDGYIVKPFTATTLKNKIERACGRTSKAA